MSKLLRRLQRGILSREAAEVVGFALLAGGFYEAFGLAAGLWAAGGSVVILATLGGRP